jgi:alkylation response protein AidB-like acyl-CoA dehydrogenase
MIDLLPDDDQTALVDSVVAVLRDEVPRARLREVLAAGDDGFDRAFLARCGQLGWFGVGLDEALAGAGLGLVEEALLFRELGRALVPGPFLATVVAGKVAAAAGNEALATKIAEGSLVAGLAEGDVLYDCGDVDLVLVVDHVGGTVGVRDRSDVRVVDVGRSIDPFHRIGRLEQPLPAPVAEGGRELIAQGAVLAAAYLCGMAEQTRDDSVAHASTRVQYGTRIGAFQAVKHRCSDMAVRAEMAWAQTAFAALRGSAFDASAAKVVAVDAAVQNARANVQNHGGMGFTAEHDAHLFLKRAHIVEQLFGDPRWHMGVALATDLPW